MSIRWTVYCVAFLAGPPAALAADLGSLVMPREEVQREARGPEAPAREAGDVIDVAESAGQFGTLIEVAQTAGLIEEWRAADGVTVFAPTDAAFAALPASAVETLLRPENREQLRRVLNYHVVSGEFTASELPGQRSAETASGGSLAFRSLGEVVTVNGVNIARANVQAANGIIHVVDLVLLPSDLALPASDPGIATGSIQDAADLD